MTIKETPKLWIVEYPIGTGRIRKTTWGGEPVENVFSTEAEAQALFKRKVYDRVRAVVGHLPQDDQLRLAVRDVVGEEGA